MRRKVAEPFENREGEIGRGQLMGEAFADQSSQFGLVIKRIEARDNPACAMTEEEKRQVRFSRSCQLNDGFDVADVILKILNIETLAIGISAAAQALDQDRSVLGV